jgi:hypothetical protein
VHCYPFEIQRQLFQNNIETDIRETLCDDMNQIGQAPVIDLFGDGIYNKVEFLKRMNNF